MSSPVPLSRLRAPSGQEADLVILSLPLYILIAWKGTWNRAGAAACQDES